MKNPLSRHRLEPVVIAGWTGIAILLWIFHAIAESVAGGGTEKTDRAILMFLRNPLDTSQPWGPVWMHEAMRDISGLGSVIVLWMLSFLAIAYLFIIRDRARAFFLMAAVIAGTCVAHLLKLAYVRPRPDLVPHGTATFTTSFPSAHSMMSAIVYLAIGMMLARAHQERGVKIYFLSVSILLSLVIGISRIYLGVHWPSDVLAGWVAGGAFALLLWAISRKFQIKISGAEKSENNGQ